LKFAGIARFSVVTDELLDMSHLCKLMDDANPSKLRGPYKKREAVS
jgi:hypothetical protein